MKYIALIGPHGVGKSTIADAARDALCAEGIPVFAFHHATPSDPSDPVLSALEYTAQRRRFTTSAPPIVMAIVAPRVLGERPAEIAVCDRWSIDTEVTASALHAIGQWDEGNALTGIYRAERAWIPTAIPILLDAPDSVLDARIAARGAKTTPLERAERDRVRDLGALWLRVDTSTSVDEAVATIVEIVRRRCC